jgi:hypothetical protein
VSAELGQDLRGDEAQDGEDGEVENVVQNLEVLRREVRACEGVRMCECERV